MLKFDSIPKSELRKKNISGFSEYVLNQTQMRNVSGLLNIFIIENSESNSSNPVPIYAIMDTSQHSHMHPIILTQEILEKSNYFSQHKYILSFFIECLKRMDI